MELQELIERIDRWKARQQGSAPGVQADYSAEPPPLPMDEDAVEEESVVEEFAAENGIVEDVEPVEEEAPTEAPAEETSEVGLDQVEEIEEVEEP